MKFFKGVLLAAPATLIAGITAHATDLPANKAAPIQYVRVCDAYGSGFFYIPGTDTCLRVGGYVRAEYNYTPGKRLLSVASSAANVTTQIARSQDTTGMEVRGRVDLDARTQTEWGTVQTVVWLRATNTDGMKSLSGATATSAAITLGGYLPAGNGASAITIERAYVRFAGLTAGVAEENFSAMAGSMWVNYPYASFPNGIKQLAYTATFGGGFINDRG